MSTTPSILYCTSANFFKYASPIGQPRRRYFLPDSCPENVRNVAIAFDQDFQMRLDQFPPAVRNTPSTSVVFSNNSGTGLNNANAILVSLSEPANLGAGIGQFTATFATVPASWDEYSSIPFTTPTLLGVITANFVYHNISNSRTVITGVRTRRDYFLMDPQNVVSAVAAGSQVGVVGVHNYGATLGIQLPYGNMGYYALTGITAGEEYVWVNHQNDYGYQGSSGINYNDYAVFNAPTTTIGLFGIAGSAVTAEVYYTTKATTLKDSAGNLVRCVYVSGDIPIKQSDVYYPCWWDPTTTPIRFQPRPWAPQTQLVMASNNGSTIGETISGYLNYPTIPSLNGWQSMVSCAASDSWDSLPWDGGDGLIGLFTMYPAAGAPPQLTVTIAAGVKYYVTLGPNDISWQLGATTYTINGVIPSTNVLTSIVVKSATSGAASICTVTVVPAQGQVCVRESVLKQYAGQIVCRETVYALVK